MPLVADNIAELPRCVPSLKSGSRKIAGFARSVEVPGREIGLLRSGPRRPWGCRHKPCSREPCIAKWIELGVMALTPGAGRVSLTVSVTLSSRLKLPAPVWRKTCTSTGPADSPGRFGARAVAAVGNGTVSVVLPVRAVARACARTNPLRTKLTTGSPNPRFAKPLPVRVKLAGGAARSIELGVMALTPGAVPVTARDTSPAFEVKFTLPAKLPAAVGLKRTITV